MSLEPYSNDPVACLPYDPEAPVVADRVAGLIRAVVPSLRIEHIGSTAVPGCPGKGVVDLMLLYGSGGLEQAKAALTQLGFQPQTTRDPFPESRPMRVGAISHRGRTYRLHVHVLERDAAEVSELLAFRNRLRSDPEFLEAYIQVKRDVLARGITDGVDYADAKAWFFRP